MAAHTLALHRACIEGSLSEVRNIVTENEKACGVRDVHGCLPIHYACQHPPQDGVPVELIQLVSGKKCEYISAKSCISGRSRSHWQCENVSKKRTGKGDRYVPCGQTPLHVACHSRNYDFAAFLIKKNCVFSDNCFGKSPLHIVSANGDLDIAKFLIDNFPRSSSSRDRCGAFPLHYAVLGGFPKVVELLIKKQRRTLLTSVACVSQGNAHFKCVAERGVSGQTALHLACMSSKLDIGFIKDLLKNIQFDKVLNCHKQTLLNVVCKVSKSVDVVKLLLQLYGNKMCMVSDIHLCTPLHYACLNNSVEIVKLLFEGSDVMMRVCKIQFSTQLSDSGKPDFSKHGMCRRRRDKLSGETPLHLAVINGNVDILNILLNNCTNHDNFFELFCNCKGQTLLHVACMYGHVEIVKLLLILLGFAMCGVMDFNECLPEDYALKLEDDSISRMKLNNMLVCVTEQRAFDSWPQIEGSLHFACRSGVPDLVMHLVKNYDLKFDKVFCGHLAFDLWPEGIEQFHNACRTGVAELVAHLYEKRESILTNMNKRNKDGKLAVELWPEGKYQLHEACKSGVPELVQYLIEERNCETCLRDKQGRVAFSLWPDRNDQLHKACRVGSSELVKYLVTERECDDISAYNLWPEGKEHDACRSKVVKLVESLLDNNKFDTMRLDSKNGQIPLHVACQIKSLEISKLVSHNCDINKQDFNGSTPLHIACNSGHMEIAMFLVYEKNASIDVRDSQGTLPFALWPQSEDQVCEACAKGFSELAEHLIKERLCTPLVKICNLWPEKFSSMCESALKEKGLASTKLESKDTQTEAPVHLSGECETIEDTPEKSVHSTQKNDLASKELESKGTQTEESMLFSLQREYETKGGKVEHVSQGNTSKSTQTNEFMVLSHQGEHKTEEPLKSDLTEEVECFSEERGLFSSKEWESKSTQTDVCMLLGQEEECKAKHASNSDLSGEVEDFSQERIFTDSGVGFESWPDTQEQFIGACKTGMPELVAYVYEHREFEVTQRNKDGKIAFELWPEGDNQLHEACKSGVPELVTFLVRKRECSTEKNTSNQRAFEQWPDTPEQFHKACKSGLPELAAYVYQRRKFDISVRNRQGQLAVELWPQCEDQLHEACKSGVPELVKYVIQERGCNLKKVIHNKVAFEFWPDNPDQIFNACKSGVPELLEYIYENRKFKIDNEAFELWPEGDNQLHEACKSGVPELVTFLVRKRECSTEKTISSKRAFELWPDTPEQFHKACKSGLPELVAYVYQHRKFDISVRNRQGQLAVELWPECEEQLHEACKSGVPELVKYLIEVRECKPCHEDSQGRLPFSLWPDTEDQVCSAISAGIPELVMHLLRKGKIMQPFYKACKMWKEQLVFSCGSGDPELLRVCLNQMGVIESELEEYAVVIRDRSGPFYQEAFKMWPDKVDQLRIACQSGIPELVHQIYLRGCFKEKDDVKLAFELWPNGEYQLHEACKSGIPELVQYLLNYRKCDISLKDTDEKVAFDYWQESGNSLQTAFNHGIPEIVHHLTHQRETPLDLNFDDWPESDEQLWLACKSGILDLVKHIFQKRNCKRLIDKVILGSTPLHMACSVPCIGNVCKGKYFSLIQFLVNDAKAKCDIKDTDGKLPLHIACGKLSLTAVEYVSNFGRDPHGLVDAVSECGERPIDIAARRIHEEEKEQDKPNRQLKSEAFKIVMHLVDKKRCTIYNGEDNILLKLMKREAETVSVKQLKMAKLILTGPPGVGKTTFCNRLVKRCTSSSTKTEDLSGNSQSKVKMKKLTDIYAIPTPDGEQWNELSTGHLIAIQTRQKWGLQQIENSVIVHMLDIGGQPGFHRLLPALVTGPGIYLIFFKLNEDLWERRVIEIVPEELPFCEKYVVSYTPENVIFKTISTVSCFTQQKPPPPDLDALPEVGTDDSARVNVNPQSMPFKRFKSKNPIVYCSDSVPEPACVLVGTHRDEIEEDVINEKDIYLHSMLKEMRNFDKLITKYDEMRQGLAAALDLSRQDNQSVTDFRKFLTKLVEKKCAHVKIRPEWLSFQACLTQSSHSDVIKLAKCKDIAESCGIKGNGYKNALTYLHYHVGSVLWYRQVEVYKDQVIVNIQSLYDSIIMLMTNTFTEDDKYYKDFTTKGQFTLEALAEKSSPVKHHCYKFENLIKLLIYLHIAVYIPKQKVYFMPSLLRSSGVELLNYSKEQHPHPLLIYFDCGFCPVGMFSFFIVELLQCKSLKWRLCNVCTRYSNKFVMKVGPEYDEVQIIEKSTFYEVWMKEDDDDIRSPTLPYPKRCLKVKESINECLVIVEKRFNYDKLSKHRFAFFCPRKLCQEQYSKRYNNVAIVDENDEEELKCLACKKGTGVPDLCQLWYGRPSVTQVKEEKQTNKNLLGEIFKNILVAEFKQKSIS